MTLMLMSAALWAEETITVSANSSDISEGLDLKVVAKLFAESKNLEEFENMLNNPDSAFCNLDLNGDGQVDYLRVVETGEGNKRLIVLQAVLAKDIYQDVASIYVEKDEKEQVSVQIVGDEYVYGTNYIIEPVYVYRPAIYDWFWSTAWVAWYSPWYWGYWPSWWYVHNCWAHDWYWHHCYAYHHHHHVCSFRPGREIRRGYYDLHSGVTRREYATAHPDRSFTSRNNGMSNAREIRNTNQVDRRTSGASQRSAEGGHSMDRGRHAEGTRSSVTERGSLNNRNSSFDRTFGSRTTSQTRSSNASQRTSTQTRSSNTTQTRSSNTTQRSVDTRSSSGNTGRSSYSGNSSRSSYSGNSSRSSSPSYSGSSSRSSSPSYSGSSRSSSSSYSGSSSRSSSFSGGGGSSRGGGFSGGSGGGRSSGGGGPRR